MKQLCGKNNITDKEMQKSIEFHSQDADKAAIVDKVII